VGREYDLSRLPREPERERRRGDLRGERVFLLGDRASRDDGRGERLFRLGDLLALRPRLRLRGIPSLK